MKKKGRPAKARYYGIRMTRATMAMIKQVAKDERRTQGEVVQRCLSLYLDGKDNERG